MSCWCDCFGCYVVLMCYLVGSVLCVLVYLCTPLDSAAVIGNCSLLFVKHMLLCSSEGWCFLLWWCSGAYFLSAALLKVLEHLSCWWVCIVLLLALLICWLLYWLLSNVMIMVAYWYWCCLGAVLCCSLLLIWSNTAMLLQCALVLAVAVAILRCFELCWYCWPC